VIAVVAANRLVAWLSFAAIHRAVAVA